MAFAVALKPTTIAVYLLAAALLTYILIDRLRVKRRQQAFAREHNCQPLLHWLPLKDPIFGIDDVYAKLHAAKNHRVLELLHGSFKKNGHTFGRRVLGQNAIVTCEPDNVKTVLSLRFKEYGMSNRVPTLGPLLGFGIFTTDGDRWAHSRALIRPNFIKEQVANLESFEALMQDLLRLIPRDGSTVDLQDLFFRYTIDSATEFLFGQPTRSLRAAATAKDASAEDKADDSFARAFNRALFACATRSRVGPLLKVWPKDRNDEENIRICHAYVDQFVDQALRYREKRDLEKNPVEDKYVFLHSLAATTRDKKRLRDELMNVLLAGRDTTASLLSNMWFQLVKDPRIFAKLRAEVHAHLPHGELPTYATLKNMTYLKYCMNESLRLHTIVPANSRVALQDSVLPLGGGERGDQPLFVPRGTVVMYNTFAMHRRPDLFGADAEQYRPERWELLRPKWEFVPFSGGPRICLGQQYALTEAGYVTVRLMQELGRIEARDDGPWEENVTLTLCSRNGVKVGVWPKE